MDCVRVQGAVVKVYLVVIFKKINVVHHLGPCAAIVYKVISDYLLGYCICLV